MHRSRTCFVVSCILALLTLPGMAGQVAGEEARRERLRAAKRAGDVTAARAITGDQELTTEGRGAALPSSIVQRVVRTELLQRGGGWRADVLVSDPSRASAAPAMAIRSDGTLYIAVEEQTSNYLDIYTSPDGGFVWTYEFSLLTAQDPTRPAIAIGEGNRDRLLIAYEYGRGTSSSAIHVYWEDLDNGGSGAVLVEANPLGVSNPQICVDNPEFDYWYAYVAYGRTRLVDRPDASDLRFSRTLDFGAHWTTPATIAPDIAELDRPDIDYGEENLYVTFSRLYTPGDRDVYVRRSTDLGSTWDNELLIGGSAADEYNPRVAATNGDEAVVVAYTRVRATANTDIECFASTNAGASWIVAPMPYTSAAEDLVDLTVSESYGRIHAAFWRNFDIVYTWADCGTPQDWADAEIINEDHAAVANQRPAIAANPWKPVEPCVAWTDCRVSGYRRIYFDAAYPLGEFAVIASIDLAEEVLPLLDWKRQIGYDAYQIVLEWIYSTYPGADDAEKIWNYLADHYPEIGYVLLIGDVDELPMRRLYPDGPPGSLLGYGTDYYYAKLDVTSWDLDGDGRWGEFNEDGLDPVPDLLVGRIPFNDESIVQTICLDIVYFESSSGPWKESALLAHGLLDMDTDSGDLGERLRQDFFGSWSVETLYEKGGLAPSTHACTAPLGTESYRSRCSLARQALVSCVAHGHPAAMSGQRWINDHIPNGRPDYQLGELGYTEFSRAGDIPTHPVSAVVFLTGCSTAPILGPDSLADASPLRSRYLIRTPLAHTMVKNYLRYGAPVVIGATAGSGYQSQWTAPANGGGQSLSYYFHDYLLADHMQVGQAFYDAMLHYAAVHGFDRGIRVFNYYGDPSLSLEVPEYLAGRMDREPAARPILRPADWRSAIAAGRRHADRLMPPAAPLIEQPPTWAETGAMENAITINHLLEPEPGRLLAAVMTRIDTTTTRGQVLRSTNAGTSWQMLGALAGCRALTAIGQAEPQVLLAAGWADLGETQPGVIYRSGDGGATWESVFTIRDGIVTALLMVGPGEWLAAAYGRPEADLHGYIVRSTDSGSSWQPWGELGADMYPHSLARGESGLLFAGVSFDQGQAGSILRSENGIDWLPMSGLDADATSVPALLATPEWLYAGVAESDGGFVYVTEPFGTVWTKTTELPDPDVRAVESLVRDRWGKIYAGVEMDAGQGHTRVYRMTPGPAGYGEWSAYGGGIDQAESVHALAATTECMVAATAFNGVPGLARVLRCALDGAVGVGDEGTAPAPRFELEQNVPNPFNPRTLIRYKLSTPGSMRIDIYDTMGRRVRALVHERFEPAGSHAVHWDGTDDQGRAVASGIYFYRLDAGAASEVRRMVLLR